MSEQAEIRSLPEPPPEELDEDAASLRQIREMLAQTPVQRLAGLRNAYPLFLAGQRRRGRRVLGEPKDE